MITGNAIDPIDDPFWDDLLAYLHDRRVIPIVDTGSLWVTDGSERLPLETLLTRRLAQRLRLDLAESGDESRIDALVRRQRASPGRKENLYLRIQQILKDLDIAPPEALLDIAAIDAYLAPPGLPIANNRPSSMNAILVGAASALPPVGTMSVMSSNELSWQRSDPTRAGISLRWRSAPMRAARHCFTPTAW